MIEEHWVVWRIEKINFKKLIFIAKLFNLITPAKVSVIYE
jgi:hypothetical protein